MVDVMQSRGRHRWEQMKGQWLGIRGTCQVKSHVCKRQLQGPGGRIGGLPICDWRMRSRC